MSFDNAGQLRELWQGAVQSLPRDPTLAPVGGVNLRIDLQKACAAVVATSKAIGAGTLAAATLDPISLFGVVPLLVSAVALTLDSVREPMNALHYVTYLVLGESARPLTPTELGEHLDSFLAIATRQRQPWYLGLAPQLLEEALRLRRGTRVEDLIMAMVTLKYAQRAEGDRVAFTPRNVVLVGR